MHKETAFGVTSIDGKLIEVIQAATDPKDLILLQEIVAKHPGEEALRKWVDTQREQDAEFVNAVTTLYDKFVAHYAELSAAVELPQNMRWWHSYLPFARGVVLVAAMRYFTIAGPKEKEFWRWYVAQGAPHIRGSFAPFKKEERGRALTEAIFADELRLIHGAKEEVNLDDPDVAEETEKKFVEEGISIQPDIFSDEPGKQIFPAIRHEFDALNKKKDKD